MNSSTKNPKEGSKVEHLEMSATQKTPLSLEDGNAAGEGGELPTNAHIPSMENPMTDPMKIK